MRFLYWILSCLSLSSGASSILSPPDNCDRTIVHTDEGSSKGEFVSYNYPKKYPPNLQCIYTFVAKSNERVDITFHQFSLAGSGPKYCIDYIDVYSEIKNPEDDIFDQRLSGRFCGTISPHRIVSLYSTVVIVFHTRNNTAGDDGFQGEYMFVSNGKYAIGTPAPSGACGYTVYSKRAPSQSGDIFSPTYPGNYPANMECTYRLLGEKGQRIKLEFTDFDLFFVGQHCPYDYIIVFDGDSPKAPVIQRVCGMQQKLEIFSERENLFILFKTSRPPTFEHHRGFKMRYTFSSEFVDVARLKGTDASIDHMRGTECDIRVRSGKETRHTITSPNYPHQYPLNRTCVYYLDGKQGPQELEKVNLTFESFSIASRVDGLNFPTEDTEDHCGSTFVSIYTSGDSRVDKSPLPEPDHKLCGSGELPKTRESEGPRMILLLQSGPQPAPAFWHQLGFRATVQFKTDFGIPGTPIQGSNVCQFEFNSADRKSGEFNSPRFPSSYPTKTECVYHFKGLENENVNISFEQFSLAPGLSDADECGDWLEIYTIYPKGIPSLWGSSTSLSPVGYRESVSVRNGHYCKGDTPGPIASGFSSNQMKVVFHSDERGVATGFKAKYTFSRETPLFQPKSTSGGKCGGVVEGPAGGVIKYPEQMNGKYERGLNCNWLIRSPPGTKVLLQLFNKFEVEGTTSYNEKTRKLEKVDCGNAIFRVYLNETGVPKAEFCGTKLVPIYTEFLSITNQIRVNFMTGPPHGSDLQGFYLSWTVVSKSESCTGFRCVHNGYCINEELRCNEVPNCGLRDISDESKCNAGEPKPDKTLLIIGGICGVLLFLLATVTCVLIRKRRKSRRSRAKNPHQRVPPSRMVGDGVTYFHAFT